MSPRIDAHAHFFDPGYVDQLPESCRRQSPDEITLYQALAQRNEIEQVLAVGYEGDPWAAGNNRYLAEVARDHSWDGPVAYVNEPARLTVAQLQAWQSKRFVGISLYLMNSAAATALERVTDDVWEWLVERAWMLSVNSTGELWASWITVLTKYPELRLLISHLGLPPAVLEAPTRDEAAMRMQSVTALASFPYTHVKFSGFYALTKPCYAYPHEPSWPYAEVICDHFGTRRIVWASDFSPALEFVSFPQTIGVVGAMHWLSDSDLSAIFNNNIARLLADTEERNRAAMISAPSNVKPQQQLCAGFVGLGAMGAGMTASLLRAGIAVQGYDINPQAVARLAEYGGIAAASPAEAATSADVLILMVLNSDQADQALFGESGAVASMTTSTVVMLCSTVSPTYVRALSQRLAARQILLLDAPVSGGTARAAQGKLSVMASGSPAAFGRAAPFSDALAENVYPMGDEPGQGATMKLVNQVLAGVHIAAAAEALALGSKAGIDPNRIFEVISSSAGASWMFQNRVPHILADDYTPHSTVDIWLKDLDLVVDTGKALQVPTPMSAIAHQLFVMASASGFGRLDDAAVIKVFEKIANFRVLDAVLSSVPVEASDSSSE